MEENKKKRKDNENVDIGVSSFKRRKEKEGEKVWKRRSEMWKEVMEELEQVTFQVWDVLEETPSGITPHQSLITRSVHYLPPVKYYWYFK